MEYAVKVFDASTAPRGIILNDEGKKRVLEEWKLSNHEEVLIEGTGELVEEQALISPSIPNNQSNSRKTRCKEKP